MRPQLSSTWRRAKITYHACLPRERPQSTELVVSEEAQLNPLYIMEVEVHADASQLRIARHAAEAHDREAIQPGVVAPSESTGSGFRSLCSAGTAGTS